MNIFLTFFTRTLVLDYILFVKPKTVCVSRLTKLSAMDNESISQQVTKLIKRLKEAEKQAGLLQGEIQHIRSEIADLRQSADSILSANTIFKRQNHTLTSNSTKRFLDENDGLDGNQEKKLCVGIPEENGYAVAYTDGACENNGKSNAKAGIGVWFSTGNPMNISKPVIGRATNNTGEIQAAVEALKVLHNLGYSKVKLHTDSQFTINCITKWIKKWKKNQWKLAGGGPVKNKEDLVKLDSLCQKFEDIKWEYCPGHRGVYGNEEADKLAREGALRYTK